MANLKGPDDPQRLLPEDLRDSWRIVPKTVLYGLLLIGLMFGAGIALSIVGFVIDHEWLKLGLPTALLIHWLLDKLLTFPDGLPPQYRQA